MNPQALQDKTTSYYRDKAKTEEKASEADTINKTANWSLSLMGLSIISAGLAILLIGTEAPEPLGIISMVALFLGGDLALKTLYKASKTQAPSKRRLKAKAITALAMALLLLLGSLAVLVITTHDMIP